MEGGEGEKASDQNGGATSSSSKPSLLFRAALNGIRAKWPQAKQMSTQTLSSLMGEPSAGPGDASQAKLLLLDTRDEAEFNVSHLPGAVRVSPEAEDVEDIKQQVLTDGIQNVICYCSMGYRSSKYATYLQQSLNKESKDEKQQLHVYNLEGSIFQWANEERPLVDSQGRKTRMVHPFSVVWGKFLKAELRKWPDS